MGKTGLLDKYIIMINKKYFVFIGQQKQYPW